MDADQAVQNLAATVLQNLRHQHDWRDLELVDNVGACRPLIRGLPPKRLYLHPDDQVAALAHEEATGEKLFQEAEYELVLSTHLSEKWSLAKFSSVFDSIPKHGPRPKRIVLATVHNDSTIVYYIMHEGMVKPRQN
ncbi:hypothetical protein E4U42_007641 [Claviceps africana]|uniref:tRNA-splicing endonuclease subunit Sen15 domain-containing protein n=1 Tax=Claviceps africana TaxID=83212 RepID=A0A8K0JAW4_9HYPO|nr:hypothetical protein E4U42_007641 [Claviceps africana]